MLLGLGLDRLEVGVRHGAAAVVLYTLVAGFCKAIRIAFRRRVVTKPGKGNEPTIVIVNGISREDLDSVLKGLQNNGKTAIRKA